MARLKFKQVYSNLSYNSGSNQLTISGSNNALIISGSAQVVSTPSTTGSLSIQNIDTFGDSGSFFTIDLGDY
jgi:hypothetical protein